ncbi:MAG TPA: potassium-transporting ATPase subunit F [Bacteroidota bacterium]|nr:potassium-transporting ATPase subunit F [Bacteroidota bacterium]
MNAEIGKEMKMVVGFIVAALLLAYLIYTLVKPEKF